MLNFITHSLSRLMKSASFKHSYLQKGGRVNNWPAVLQCGFALNVFDSRLRLTKWHFTFLSSGDFKGDKFAVVGLYDSSACHKILLPCFPSLLINHRQSTEGLCIGKQQTTYGISFSTVYICYPIPKVN